MRKSAKVILVTAGLLSAGIIPFIGCGEKSHPIPDRFIRKKIERALNYSGPNRWERILRAGIEAGRMANMDLETLARISRTIPEGYRGVFFDGAAHGIDWPSEDMHSCLAAIKEFIPERYRSELYSGPILHLVREERGDPERVMARLSNLPPEMKRYLSNGLRIGLLLTYRERLEDAIPVILRYPAEYHHHIFEEFGWWMGQNLGDDTGAVTELADKVPETYRGEVYAGYIRGLDLSDRVKQYQQVVLELDPAYRDICARTLVTKIATLYGPDRRSKQQYYEEEARKMKENKNLFPDRAARRE